MNSPKFELRELRLLSDTKEVFFKQRSKFLEAQNALEANQYDKAEALYSKVLEERPETVEALWHRALVRQRLGKLNEALTDAQESNRLRPENAIGLMICGEILLEKKDYLAAYENLLHACKLEKDNGRVFCSLARACVGLGKKEEASDYFELALQFERDFTLARCFTEILSR